jgi:tetratricopeptide (TPR) repeat protein
MKNHVVLKAVSALAALLLPFTGCAKKKVDDGKIPITTASEEARKEFLQGRDLSERLRVQDSIVHFENAVSKDPNFACAYYGLALAAPTPKGFFDNMKKAVALADKPSEGERLLIKGFQAGVDSDQPKQQEIYEKLVAAYPKDERAHFMLGNYYTNQQEYAKAIEEYQKCTAIDSNYSPAYNSLGYAYKFLQKYDDAEKAFQKYTEMIPNDPNPPDSYGELLLKMGKFDDSIKEYQKALSMDQYFASSRIGVASNLLYKGKPDEAMAELQKLQSVARNDGELRTALLGMTVVNFDAGKLEEALAGMDKQFAVAEKASDVASMAADLATKANILQEMGKYDEATALYQKSVKLIENSDLSQAIKDNAILLHHYGIASVAIGKKDLKTARAEAENFAKGAEAIKNTTQIRQGHELMGRISLLEKKYDDAIAQLQQANQQNPYNLYYLSLAYQGKKDKEKAKEFCTKAAQDYSTLNLNYAFIRNKAVKMLSTM